MDYRWSLNTDMFNDDDRSSQSSLRMERVSSMWLDLQKQNRLPRGVLTSTCEAELQELMRHMDIMVDSKKREWEDDARSLTSQLESQEKECLMQRTALEQKHKEIGQLRQQVDMMERGQQELVEKYEEQLSLLKGQVEKMKKDYEKLHKRHLKHKKEAETERENVEAQVQGNLTEVRRLTAKLKEFHQHAREWDLEKRLQHNRMEDLESEKKGLTEKCDLMQQQSHTYQSQLDKRQQILNGTELSFKSQIHQLEVQLQRANEGLSIQNNKVTKLKASLDETMKAHKKAMDDNERLLNDLRKANHSVRRMEEENMLLQTDLRTRHDLLQMTEEGSRQHAKDRIRYEQTLLEKDSIIRSLGDIKNKEQSEQIRIMRESLHEFKEEAMKCKMSENKLRTEVSNLQIQLQRVVSDCEALTDKLQSKATNIPKQDVGEIVRLKTEVSRLTSQLETIEVARKSEVSGFKTEITKQTENLHQRDVAVAELSEKAAATEKQLRIEVETANKRSSEIQVANAQIEALRLENRHLRHTVLQQAHTTAGHSEAESRMRTIQNAYTTTIAKLEQENEQLREDIDFMKQELMLMDDKEMTNSQLRMPESVKHSSEQQINLMEEQLDATTKRYEEQLKVLKEQNAHLEDELEMEKLSSTRLSESPSISTVHEEIQSPVNNDTQQLQQWSSDVQSQNMTVAHQDWRESTETVMSTRPMTLSESSPVVDNLDYVDDHPEEPDLSEEASGMFLASEQQKTKELESIINSHIQNLKSGTHP